MAPGAPGAVVVEPVVNMYSAPSEDADVVSQAVFGSSVVVMEEKGAWAKVRTADDYSGWMRLAALRRYGADDCSGFTQMLVRQRGIVMPRDADLQAAWTGVVPVKRSHLRAGDLLFFRESPQKITHTGMFIGHGRFIHDTTHDHPGVQIGRLADQPWTHLLVACRRLK